MPKPTSKPSWMTGVTGPSVAEPPSPKKSSGWNIGERPAREYFNWLFQNVSDWIDWFDSQQGTFVYGYRKISAAGGSTIVLTDAQVIADTASGAQTYNLPTAVGITGKLYTFKIVSSGTLNPLTIDPAGSETVDGATAYQLTEQYQFVTVMSDGANWNIVSAG